MVRGGAETKVEAKHENTKSHRENEKGQRNPIHDIPTPARQRKREQNDATRGPASALEELVRRRGVDEAWSALQDMQRQGIPTDKFTVSRMLMKTVGDSRCRLNPQRVYRGIALVEKFIELQPKDVDEVLFNALLDTCCRLKDLPRLEATVQRMKDLKVTPSPVTLGILVKTHGQAGDLQKVLQVWSEMETQREQANAVTYGCMIDACVKCGNLEKAVEIFNGMKSKGKHKNTILYTTLIKGYGLEKDLVSAIALFREMLVEDVPYNTITYNSIIDACIKCGDLPKAEQLLREMTSDENNPKPDLITFSTLLKGYCHVGDIDKALRVAEDINERGLRKDELVYNTLMDGCVKANDITAGVGLFEEMVQQQMRPSAITQSILLRLYQRAPGYEDVAAATEAVAQLFHHHGIERPSGNDRGKGTKKCWRQRDRDDHSTGQSAAVLPQFGGDLSGGNNTPVGGNMAGSGGLFLPMEAMRQCPMPMAHGTYLGATPTGCEQAFGMHGVHAQSMAFMHPVASPMACMTTPGVQPGQQLPAMPHWQFPNGAQFCGVQMQNAMAACVQMHGPGMSPDSPMQFGMMHPHQQTPHMPAMSVNMQQNSFAMTPVGNVQGTPFFPMPLSPPHDLAHSGFPHGAQPYFENDWQQASGGMHVSNPMGNACPQ